MKTLTINDVPVRFRNLHFRVWRVGQDSVSSLFNTVHDAIEYFNKYGYRIVAELSPDNFAWEYTKLSNN
jgi:hypothetical protein